MYKNFFKYFSIVLIILINVFSTSTVNAKVKEFIGTGEHYIEDEEIDDDMEEKEIIELQTNYDAFSQSESFTAQLALDIQQETEKSETSSRPQEVNIKIANFVAARAAKSVIELNRQVKIVGNFCCK